MKRVCGFAVSHILLRRIAVLRTYMRPIVTEGVACSVSLSVGLSGCHISEAWENGWSDRDAVWVEDSGGANEPCMGSRSPMAILRGKRANHCKVYGYSAVICAKTAEPIDLPFALWSWMGRRMHKFNRIRQVGPMFPHGRTHCRQLANTIEPSVYVGDAPYVKLLWPLVTFGHAHLDNRTDSRALRDKYCIVGIPHNTVI